MRKFIFTLAIIIFLGAIVKSQVSHAHQEDDVRFMTLKVVALTETGFTYERLQEHEVGELHIKTGVFQVISFDNRVIPGGLHKGARLAVLYCYHCHAVFNATDLDSPK